MPGPFRASHPADDALFEIFHENTKLGRHPRRVLGLRGGDPDWPLAAGPAVELADADGTDTALPFSGLPRAVVASLLAQGDDGISGALGLFFTADLVAGLATGLYRHEPTANHALLVSGGTDGDTLAATLIEPELGGDTYLTIVVAARFAPFAARFGERGYRYALIGAGAVAARIGARAASLGLAASVTGEFRDRELDRLLQIDGVDAGALLMVLIRRGAAPPPEPPQPGRSGRVRRRRRRGRR